MVYKHGEHGDNLQPASANALSHFVILKTK